MMKNKCLIRREREKKGDEKAKYEMNGKETSNIQEKRRGQELASKKNVYCDVQRVGSRHHE